jgi:glycosyltransferase involved in cell wall biosynthesis
VSPEKVMVVLNGVDTEFFSPELYKPRRVFEGFTVGFVGTLFPWQGLDLLLETLSELRAEGLNLSLVVVGDGSEREGLEAQARRLGISSNVAFAGRVPQQEVPRWISGFDVGYSGHVRLKLGEMYHSPLKLYEYMAMAKPAVASAFEDARRTVREGETGFLFRAGDRADLRRALIKAYESRGRVPEMGRKAREHILKYHGWRARVEAIIEGVERILDLRR